MTEKEMYITSYLNNEISSLSFGVPKLLNTKTNQLELNGIYERLTPESNRTINEVFDFIIIYHPELLSIYPYLNSKYKMWYDDLVIRKEDFCHID